MWVARKPAGFAFCWFQTKGDAQKAVDRLNGVDLRGRLIRVELSDPARVFTLFFCLALPFRLCIFPFSLIGWIDLLFIVTVSLMCAALFPLSPRSIDQRRRKEDRPCSRSRSRDRNHSHESRGRDREKEHARSRSRSRTRDRERSGHDPHHQVERDHDRKKEEREREKQKEKEREQQKEREKKEKRA